MSFVEMETIFRFKLNRIIHFAVIMKSISVAKIKHERCMNGYVRFLPRRKIRGF
jgi:hypothetical protein